MTAVATRPRGSHAVDVTATRPLPVVQPTPAGGDVDVHTDPSWDMSIAALSLAEALRTARTRGYTTPSGGVRVGCREVTAPLTYTGVLEWQQLLARPRIRRAAGLYLHVSGWVGDTEWHLHTEGPQR